MKNIKLFKSSLESGLIFGLILVIINVLMYVFNYSPLGFGKMILMMLFFLALYYIGLHIFTKQYKEKVKEGQINYSEAFFFGVLVVFWASLFLAVYTFVFNAVIDPNYAKVMYEDVKEWTYNMMQERNVPQNIIDEQMAKLESQGVPSAFKSTWMGFLNSFIIGVLMALISAAVVKTKKDIFKESI